MALLYLWFFFSTTMLFPTGGSIEPPKGNNTTRVIKFPIIHINKLLSDRKQLNAYSKTPSMVKSGHYLIQVRIGSKKQLAHLLLDTGSSFSWWQCNSYCEGCYEQSDPRYDPESSSSFKELMCNSMKCAKHYPIGCRGNRCGYSIHYADKDSSMGYVVADKISTRDGTLVQELLFGCSAYNEGQHFSNVYSGIMGFGRGLYGIPTQLQAFKFSFCLPAENEKSYLYLRDFPPFDERDDENAITVPINTHQGDHATHYYMEFNGVAINGKMIPVSTKMWEVDYESRYGVIVDTGTAFTQFPPEVYAVFRDEFRKAVPEHHGEPFEAKRFDTCYISTANDFPEVSFFFSDKRKPWVLSPQQAMLTKPFDKLRDIYCLAFRVTPHLTVIGSFQLGGMRLSFDLVEMILRFDEDHCN